VCELNRCAQQVVNSDGCQLDGVHTILRATEALLILLGHPHWMRRTSAWDVIKPLLIPFVMADKVEDVHGKSVCLLVVFGRPLAVVLLANYWQNAGEFLENPYCVGLQKQLYLFYRNFQKPLFRNHNLYAEKLNQKYRLDLNLTSGKPHKLISGFSDQRLNESVLSM
jgi:hypothetical protein